MRCRPGNFRPDLPPTERSGLDLHNSTWFRPAGRTLPTGKPAHSMLNSRFTQRWTICFAVHSTLNFQGQLGPFAHGRPALIDPKRTYMRQRLTGYSLSARNPGHSAMLRTPHLRRRTVSSPLRAATSPTLSPSGANNTAQKQS